MNSKHQNIMICYYTATLEEKRYALIHSISSMMHKSYHIKNVPKKRPLYLTVSVGLVYLLLLVLTQNKASVQFLDRVTEKDEMRLWDSLLFSK